MKSKHERFFGLVRPDDSLKPHTEVIKQFTATKPTVKPIPSYAKISITGKDCYSKELFNELPKLYKSFLPRKEVAQ